MFQKIQNVSRKQGQAVMIAVVFFMIISLVIVLGVTTPVVRQIQIVKGLQLSRQSYFAAEAGSEDSYYRVKNGVTVSFPQSLTLGTASVNTALTTTGSNEEEIISTGNVSQYIRKVSKELTVTDGFSFNFGVQSGIGGLYLQNNAVIIGNVYSNGVVSGSSSNSILGSVVSAGSAGSISGVHATSSVYAHSISNTTTDKDAYYYSAATLTSSTVTGTKYPGSTDKPTIAFPITDTLISQWETDASAGGSVTCSSGTYTISSNTTLGPKKIPCDLVVSGNNVTLTITGAIWVTGNVTISGSGGTGVKVKVSDSAGDKSTAIIADNSSSATVSGKVTIDGNSNFYGSTGNADSYVMLISMNTSAENGGSNLAMDLSNGSAGNLLVYAPHGQIKLSNNVALREVTAYKLTLINNTQVIYNTGLSETLFTSGPGGTWKIKKWREKF